MRSRFEFASLCALMLFAACSSSAREQVDTVRSGSVAKASSADSTTPDSTAAVTGGGSTAPGSSPARADTTAGDSLEWTVDAHGIGRVRVGATLAALSTLLHEPLRAAYSYNETCDYVRPRALPVGVKLMVSGDTIVRVDVDSGAVKTKSGAGIGMTEARVLTMYRGRVSVQPHPYTGPVGHYLVVPAPNDTMYRMIFETDGKMVTRYRAGRRPQVDFKEGCS
jgi:hypothetical protein